jgi:hypothetical protein
MAVPANDLNAWMPKDNRSPTFVIKHLAFDLKATRYIRSLGKWAQQNALAADPWESECVYACQCGTEMQMFIGTRDRTEMPCQVLQAMQGHTRKHQQYLKSAGWRRP